MLTTTTGSPGNWSSSGGVGLKAGEDVRVSDVETKASDESSVAFVVTPLALILFGILVAGIAQFGLRRRKQRRKKVWREGLGDRMDWTQPDPTRRWELWKRLFRYHIKHKDSKAREKMPATPFRSTIERFRSVLPETEEEKTDTGTSLEDLMEDSERIYGLLNFEDPTSTIHPTAEEEKEEIGPSVSHVSAVLYPNIEHETPSANPHHNK